MNRTEPGPSGADGWRMESADTWGCDERGVSEKRAGGGGRPDAFPEKRLPEQPCHDP